MQITTIGVYESTGDSFFAALTSRGVHVFVDVRERRGLRGPAYRYANSTELQQRLAALGIRYVHALELAPSRAVHAIQTAANQRDGAPQRTRTGMDPAFREAYTRECLANFDSAAFVKRYDLEAATIALFCVERDPRACHRSLAAARLAHDLGLTVENILP